MKPLLFIMAFIAVLIESRQGEKRKTVVRNNREKDFVEIMERLIDEI